MKLSVLLKTDRQLQLQWKWKKEPKHCLLNPTRDNCWSNNQNSSSINNNKNSHINRNDYWKRKWMSMKWRMHSLCWSPFVSIITRTVRSAVIPLFSAIRCTCMIIITLELFRQFTTNAVLYSMNCNIPAKTTWPWPRQLFFSNVLIALLYVMLYHFHDCLFKHFLFLKCNISAVHICT